VRLLWGGLYHASLIALTDSQRQEQAGPVLLQRMTNKTRAGRASFTSKDDKLRAGQTKEGVLNSEKIELVR